MGDEPGPGRGRHGGGGGLTMMAALARVSRRSRGGRVALVRRAGPRRSATFCDHGIASTSSKPSSCRGVPQLLIDSTIARWTRRPRPSSWAATLCDLLRPAPLKEDIELDREETEDNRLNKVRVSSFSFLFDLPMLGILLTHPYPRHHLPPVDLLIWEYTSTGDYSSTIHHPAVLSGGPPSFMARPRCSETAERAAR